MRKKAFRHWSWLEFSTTHIVPGQNRTYRIPGNPVVDIISLSGGDLLEICIHSPLKGRIPREISCMSRITVSGGKDSIVVSTSCRSLYPEFYHMAAMISDRVQIDGEDPVSAVGAVLADMRRLASIHKPLSDSEEIGLFGELWTLKRLISLYGPKAAKAWIGPGKREHDFRFGSIELEVKTTSRVRRIHTIHGLGQMVPSQGKSLFLLSVHISPSGAGKGESLAGLRKSIMYALKSDAAALGVFRSSLDSYGLTEKDWALYKNPWVLRSPAVLLKSALCPSITSEQIGKILPADHAARIENISYEVNVERLGCPESSPEFKKFLDRIGEGIEND